MVSWGRNGFSMWIRLFVLSSASESYQQFILCLLPYGKHTWCRSDMVASEIGLEILRSLPGMTTQKETSKLGNDHPQHLPRWCLPALMNPVFPEALSKWGSKRVHSSSFVLRLKPCLSQTWSTRKTAFASQNTQRRLEFLLLGYVLKRLKPKKKKWLG